MTPCTDEKLRPKGQAEAQCPPDKGAPGGWGPTTLASVLELRPHLMGPQESEVGSCIQHRSSPISLGLRPCVDKRVGGSWNQRAGLQRGYRETPASCGRAGCRKEVFGNARTGGQRRLGN